MLGAAAVLAHARAVGAEAPGILVLDEWGIYSATLDRRVADPTATTGERTLSRDIHLIQRTHQVCAQLGTHCGIRYHVRADVPANTVELTVDVLHPPMMNTRNILQSNDESTKHVPVRNSWYTGWTFSEPRELLAGEWHIVVRRGAAIQLDETFHVHTACTATVS